MSYMMKFDDHFDRDGKPITDLTEWGRKFGDPKYKRIAETTLPDGTWISTVWLGLNHAFGDGPPLIFETMVFPAEDNLDERDMDRYSTEADAIAGHQRMVEKWSVPHVPDEL